MTDRTPTLSFRIDFPNGARFGPGKAALLKKLIETGSINAAAAALGMSYPRALKLVEQLNQTFVEPLVETQTGGKSGGGAAVTELGRLVLSLYTEICRDSTTVNRSILTKLTELCV
ncbi:MAG: LysR family transcriptional regulator [Pseudomonadota bacterium]